MGPLERLFVLEVEFFRRLRTQAPGTLDIAAPHTSFALQFGYERLIGAVGKARRREIIILGERLALAADVRDVLAARDSLFKILGIEPWTE